MYYNDYTKTITFNINENDAALAELIGSAVLDFVLDLHDFYDMYFHQMDALVVSGSDNVIVLDGPLLMAGE